MLCISGLMYKKPQSVVLVVFILFFSILAAPSWAQYASVDSIVDHYPKIVKESKQLTQLINRDFSGQEQKARAIFRWVATNVSYDIKIAESMNNVSKTAFAYSNQKEKQLKEKQFKENLVNETLNSRKAVCHGYSALIEVLCEETGLESKIVTGTLKTDPSEIGSIPKAINHAWNIVKINGQWKLIDATLAAGFISANTGLFKSYFNDGYFCTEPERFFLNHYPADEKWLLINKTKNDFATLPLYFGNYLKFGYRITAPIKGIQAVNAGSFKLLIGGLQQYDGIGYSFNNDKIIEIDQEDNTKGFDISLEGKNGQYLSIYVNGKIIVMYKILG